MARGTDEEIQLPDKYQELVYKLMQTGRDCALPHAAAFAFVSPHPKAGVTHITRTLASRMNTDLKGADSAQLTIALDCGSMAHSGIPFGQLVAESLETRTLASELEKDYTLKVQLNSLTGNWKQDYGYRVSCMEALRGLFKLILIDCSSMKGSADICSIAPLVDGVIIVVEADKTTRSQLGYLTRTIRTAGGCVLGYILNKRTYPIPSGLYQILEKGGLT